ncbi:MAG: type II toxin-antitoxin system HicA family toxin [Chitinispirillaceae bacterium]|nr:type II toxin-antitoxin system HicA family toxin [Chitinispirillaceae bacterium]
MGKLQPLKPAEFEKFLNFIGCTYVRQKGSHRVYRQSGLLRPIIVPVHSGDLPVLVIKNTLRQLNISTEQFLEILKRF